jgi:hypothetical protein
MKDNRLLRKQVWGITKNTRDSVSNHYDTPCTAQYEEALYKYPQDEILNSLITAGMYVGIVSMKDIYIPMEMFDAIGITEGEFVHISFQDPDLEFGRCRYIKIRKASDYDNPDFCFKRETFSIKAEDLHKIGIHLDYSLIDAIQGVRHAHEVAIGISAMTKGSNFIYIRQKYSMADWFGTENEVGFTRKERNFISQYLNPAFSHYRVLADSVRVPNCAFDKNHLNVNCKREQHKARRLSKKK